MILHRFSDERNSLMFLDRFSNFYSKMILRKKKKRERVNIKNIYILETMTNASYEKL